MIFGIQDIELNPFIWKSHQRQCELTREERLDSTATITARLHPQSPGWARREIYQKKRQPIEVY